MLRGWNIAEKHIEEAPPEQSSILVVINPTNEEAVSLQCSFQLDDFDLGSTMDADEVPRVEVSEARSLLIWKLPESAKATDRLELAVSVIGLIKANERLALIRRSGDIRFDEREYRKCVDVNDVLIAFLLSTVHHFVSHLRVIKQISGEIEQKITTSMENKYLLQMFALSESLVYYVDALESNAAVLARLRTVAPQMGFQQRHADALDDVILECAQAARQASIYSSVLSGLMDARGTIVNNNMNILLKNLTLINIVFLPLNLIASIGGMSEWSVMTEGMDWRLSYGVFTAAMLAIGWVTWIVMNNIINRTSRRDDHKRP